MQTLPLMQVHRFPNVEAAPDNAPVSAARTRTPTVVDPSGVFHVQQVLLRLDATTARILSQRASERALAQRPPASLDAVAFELSKVRARLAPLAEHADDPMTFAALQHLFHWMLEIGRLLRAIEAAQLYDDEERAAFAARFPRLERKHDDAIRPWLEALAAAPERPADPEPLRCAVERALKVMREI